MYTTVADTRTAVSKLNVVVVGDCMLDRYTFGDVKRVSPEAPVAVLNQTHTRTLPGGAANVALNLARLGANCRLVSQIGDDQDGQILTSLFVSEHNIQADFSVSASRKTTVKHRVIANSLNTHIVRIDCEDSYEISNAQEDEIFQRIYDGQSQIDALIISDYAKGLITDRLSRLIINFANENKIITFVDPKGNNYSKYRGCSYITPNLNEAFLAVGRPVSHDRRAISDVATYIQSDYQIGTVVITRSSEGVFAKCEHDSLELPAIAPQVVDVSGAGDSFLAALTVVAAIGWPFAKALEFANSAAGVSVGKSGASAVSLDEVFNNSEKHTLYDVSDKIIENWNTLASRIKDWRDSGLKVGFTNGCFDLLHSGHVELLKNARGMCDRLVVALNSDGSVSKLKGPSRPIQELADRLQIIAALQHTDAVTSFSDDTPLSLIQAIRPDILFKGGDYRAEEVVGYEFVTGLGGKVVIVDFVAGRSSSRLIAKASSKD